MKSATYIFKRFFNIVVTDHFFAIDNQIPIPWLKSDLRSDQDLIRNNPGKRDWQSNPDCPSLNHFFFRIFLLFLLQDVEVQDFLELKKRHKIPFSISSNIKHRIFFLILNNFFNLWMLVLILRDDFFKDSFRKIQKKYLFP